MSARSFKRNFGYFLAGAILFAVAVNIFFELTGNNERPQECLYISTL